MRIGVDLRVLAHGARTGVEAYTTSLLAHLIGNNPDQEFRLFYNALRKEPLSFPWTAQSRVSIYESRIPNRILEGAFWFGAHPKLDLRLGGLDVFLSPHIIGVEVSSSCPRVLTVHDLSFMRHPEFFSLGKRLWHALICIENQVRSAAGIIAVSHSTKRDLAEFFNLSEDKLRVIYPGVEDRFNPSPLGRDTLEAVRQKYRLPSKFILFLGTMEPRKNIPTIIRAYTILQNRYRDFRAINIVIAGKRGWLDGEIFSSAVQSPYSPSIHFPGFVAEEDRPALFHLAELFIYPSIFEGFGFPPIEAMACGIPTIVSNRASLPEVVGDGALLVDPYDPDALAEAMALMLQDRDLRKHYRQKGIAQAQQFSWEKTASETMNVLRRVVRR